MDFTRRFFIGGAACLGVMEATKAFGAATAAAARMRMGVLSDIHLHTEGDEDTFLRALEYFRDHGADAVLIAGDIADSGNAARAKKRAVPQFPTGASVAVSVAEPKDPKELKSKGAFCPAGREIGLSFPAAHAVDGCRVYEYEVTAVLCEDDVELVQAQRRMMSPDFHLPVTKLVDQVAFTFAAEDLPTKGGHYRFEVRPLECFGKKGAAIVSDIVFLG